MSGYSGGEALLLAALRAHANYDATNTSRGDFHIVGKGGSSNGYAVFRMGEFDTEMASISGIGATTVTDHTLWRTEILAMRPGRDATTVTTLQNDVATIIQHLKKYRFLQDTNGTVVQFRVTGGGPMEEVIYGNDVLVMRVIIRVEWLEELTVTYAE